MSRYASYVSDGRSAEARRTSGGSGFLGSIRAKPEAILLAAAGCAVLMAARRGRGGSRSQSRASAGSGPSWRERGEAWRDAAAEGAGALMEAAGSAADYAVSAVASVSTAAAHSVDLTAAPAQAVRSLAGTGSQWVKNASSPLAEAFGALEGQTLLLATVGLAAGAALGAALPETKIENRAFGDLRERAAEAATQFAREQLARGRAAREAATAKLKEEAAERGLDPEGLKNLAHEVAEAAKVGARAPEGRASHSGEAADDARSQAG